jgi:hypothetical protein
MPDHAPATPGVRLARRCGLRLIQLLPVNDTRVHGMWWDSYPYSSTSVHALHPMVRRLLASGPATSGMLGPPLGGRQCWDVRAAGVASMLREGVTVRPYTLSGVAQGGGRPGGWEAGLSSV